MDNNELRNSLPNIIQKLLENYPRLTAEDLKYEIDNAADLPETLQDKRKRNRKE